MDVSWLMQTLVMTLKVKNNSQNNSFLRREKPFGFSLSFLLVLFFLITISQSQAQYNHHRIYNNLLNGRFNDRLTDEAILTQKHLDDKTSAASVMAMTVEAFLSGNLNKCNHAIKITDQFLDLSSEIPYNLVIGHTAEAILKSANGKFFSALISFYNAYRKIDDYTHDNTCIEPVIYELNTFYNLAFSKIPKSYIRILSVAGIKPIFIDSTQICQQKNQQLIPSTFSTVYQLFSTTDTLIIQHPIGELSKLIAGMHYIKKQNPDKALAYLNSMDSVRSNLTLSYYYKGVAWLNKANYDKANWYFNKYLFLQQSGRYIKATLLRKKWIAIINNEPTEGLTKAIKSKGSEMAYIDKQAQKEADTEYHPKLLKSRLLFDGGRYNKSMELLQTINENTLNKSQLVNLDYRKARNLQGIKKYDDAILQYNKLLKLENNGEYFHKKAMLELGKIYIEMGQKTQAINHLSNVKNIDSDTFNDAFEQEAEMLIEKLISNEEQKNN